MSSHPSRWVVRDSGLRNGVTSKPPEADFALWQLAQTFLRTGVTAVSKVGCWAHKEAMDAARMPVTKMAATQSPDTRIPIASAVDPFTKIAHPLLQQLVSRGSQTARITAPPMVGYEK